MSKRTLSIILDDEAKTIGIEGWHLFSFLELFGIAEHISIKARLFDIRLLEALHKQEEEAEMSTDAAKEESNVL